MTFKPKTRGTFIRCVSGLFTSNEYPAGLTPAEILFVLNLDSVLKTQSKSMIDKDVKIELANIRNDKLQVVTNYINKLKAKNVITNENKLHPVFYKTQVIIEYGKADM